MVWSQQSLAFNPDGIAVIASLFMVNFFLLGWIRRDVMLLTRALP
jgi:hypothetical protein